MNNKSYSNEWLMQSCAVASIFVAIILVGIKSIILYGTNSFGVEASLLDSALDVLASIINLYAIRQSLKPPTQDYRFGYGKAEALAGLAQSMIIVSSAVWLIIERLDDFYHPKHIVVTTSAFLLMILAFCFTCGLVSWQRYILKRVDSLAVKADNMHFETDLFMDVGVIVTFIMISTFHFPIIDVLFGVSAVCFILYKTYPILKQSLFVLMDKELSNEDRQKIEAIVYKDKNVINMHQLRTRSSGQYTFIQLHIVMDSKLTLHDAHKITDDLEKEIIKAFPKSHVIIHQDCHMDESEDF